MIYEILKELNISYELVEHKAVFTVQEANFIKEKLKGAGCKNLFLQDNLNNYYLYVLPDSEKANLKKLAKYLEVKKLHFANDASLENILKLSKGSVTPLGIINDKHNKVKIIIDKKLIDQILLVHPLVNTKTIAIKYQDLIKFIKHFNHEYLNF